MLSLKTVTPIQPPFSPALKLIFYSFFSCFFFALFVFLCLPPHPLPPRGWILRYFSGLLLSPSSPLCFSHFPNGVPRSRLLPLPRSQAALQFLPHPLSMMISPLLCPQDLKYWVTKGGDKIFHNNTAGLTAFWKVCRENSQVSPCHH